MRLAGRRLLPLALACAALFPAAVAAADEIGADQLDW